MQPIKVCVLGPPAVGKTSSVTQLCKHYKLHHIKMADVIKETIDNLVGSTYLDLMTCGPSDERLFVGALGRQSGGGR